MYDFFGFTDPWVTSEFLASNGCTVEHTEECTEVQKNDGLIPHPTHGGG